MLPDPTVQHQVDRMVDELCSEYAGQFSRSQIEGIVSDSIERIGETAKVFDFVPLLAYRFARERLGAIRRATGDTTIQCAALQLRQVTVQSSGPQTSAGNGSPRLWAMGSSLR